ncbi:extensin-like domain-containing protein [Xanthobacter pseudotagetidis]|uniref:extensin-like domain-containing protein n=1 Tax=Xanthobacter pseudotagetidis TaxID=3119911 RepID=UPI003726F24B
MFLVASLVLTGLLTGCRFDFETRDAWRAEAEEQCLAEKGVVASAFMEPLSALNGSGACGMEHPFQVNAFADGNVVLEPTGKLACPVIRETDRWLAQVVQPAAMAWMGQPVTAIRHMSAYSCRGMNGDPNAKISEHAFGNALDIGAFRFADGRWVTVKDGWRGPADARGFLLQVQAGACELFTTVLAPGSNVFHYDHIHVDLMRRTSGRAICKPAPRPLPAPLIAVKAPEPAQSYPPLAYPAAAPEPASLRPPLAPAAPPPAAPVAAPDVVRQPAPDMAPPGALYGGPPRPGRDVPARGAAPPGNLPPGWIVGPEGQRPPPMSYAPSDHGPAVTGSVAARKYYTAPVPQASTIPLPKAKPGED